MIYTTSVSAIKSFWTCPTQWYIEFVKGRVLRFPPAALVAGIAWHEYMEALLTGTPREKAIADLEASLNNAEAESIFEGMAKRGKDIAKERDILVTAAGLWQDQYPVETLAVEKALSIELPGREGKFRLVGRPDRVIRFGGRIGHYQHRTLAGSKPVEPYLRVFHRNPHEGAYWIMLQREYGEDPFGTMLSLVRKLSPQTIMDSPHIALQQHPVTITPDQAALTVANICNTVDAMRRLEADPMALWYNPENDLGRYGNSLNPYVAAITSSEGWAALDNDNIFTDVRDRYPEFQPAEQP